MELLPSIPMVNQKDLYVNPPMLGDSCFFLNIVCFELINMKFTRFSLFVIVPTSLNTFSQKYWPPSIFYTSEGALFIVCKIFCFRSYLKRLQ